MALPAARLGIRLMDEDRPVDVSEEQRHNGKLFAAGIHPGTTECELREHFSQFGEVAAVAIPVHKRSGKPRGYAFVKFVEREGADRALAAGREPSGRHVVRGWTLYVKVAKPRSGGAQYQSSDDEQDLSPTKKKIFVGRLPESLTASDLRDYFEKFGDVTHAVIINSKFTNRSRGFGFVKFASEEVTQRVVEKGNHCLGGQWVDVKDATRESGSRGPSGHHHGREAAAEASSSSSVRRLAASAPPFYQGGVGSFGTVTSGGHPTSNILHPYVVITTGGVNTRYNGYLVQLAEDGCSGFICPGWLIQNGI